MVDLSSKTIGWLAGLFVVLATAAAAQVAPSGVSTGTAAPAALPPGSYIQPTPGGQYYQLPVNSNLSQGAGGVSYPTAYPQPAAGSGGLVAPGYPAQQGGTPAPGVPAASPAGTISSPQGMQIRRFGTGASAAVPNLPAPPPSVMAGPAGSRKLQSISGERIYMDGGMRVKLAGILFPPGDAGAPVRAAIRNIVRTNYFFIEREQGSPPFGDAECRAWVNLPDGRNLSVELVSLGLVRVSRQATFRSTEERDALFAAEDYARREGLGAWGK